MMTLERFETLCEAYGGDLRRWPDAERAAAAALAAHSAQARAALESAAGLDAALDAAPGAAPSGDLAARIIDSAPIRAANPPWAALAAAVTLAAGLAAGWLGSGLEAGVSETAVFAEAFAALEPSGVDAYLEGAR